MSKNLIPRFCTAYHKPDASQKNDHPDLYLIHARHPFIVAHVEMNEHHFRCWSPEALKDVSEETLSGIIWDMGRAAEMHMSGYPWTYEFDKKWRPPLFLFCHGARRHPGFVGILRLKKPILWLSSILSKTMITGSLITSDLHGSEMTLSYQRKEAIAHEAFLHLGRRVY